MVLDGLVLNHRETLCMYELNTYEEVLKKALQIEIDDDTIITITNRRLEDKIEATQRTIKDLTLRNNDLWCINYSIEGGIKDTCPHRDDKRQDVCVVNCLCYCNIYQGIVHLT